MMISDLTSLIAATTVWIATSATSRSRIRTMVATPTAAAMPPAQKANRFRAGRRRVTKSSTSPRRIGSVAMNSPVTTIHVHIPADATVLPRISCRNWQIRTFGLWPARCAVPRNVGRQLTNLSDQLSSWGVQTSTAADDHLATRLRQRVEASLAVTQIMPLAHGMGRLLAAMAYSSAPRAHLATRRLNAIATPRIATNGHPDELQTVMLRRFSPEEEG